MRVTLLILTIFSTTTIFAQEDSKYFVRAYAGLGTAADLSFPSEGFLDATSGDVSPGTGFWTGASFGWDLNERWALELAWDYRSNENDEASFDNGQTYEEGNLASSIVYLNALYHFRKPDRKLTPYVGAGLGWVEEVDVDFELDGIEQSFSSSSVAWQLIGGLEMPLSKRWKWFAEARYGQTGSEDLEQELGDGILRGIDQSALSLSAGVTLRF